MLILCDEYVRDDFGLVEKWKLLFWGLTFVIQYLSVIVSSAESQQRYACVNQTCSIRNPGKIFVCLHLHDFIIINVHY